MCGTYASVECLETWDQLKVAGALNVAVLTEFEWRCATVITWTVVTLLHRSFKTTHSWLSSCWFLLAGWSSVLGWHVRSNRVMLTAGKPMMNTDWGQWHVIIVQPVNTLYSSCDVLTGCSGPTTLYIYCILSLFICVHALCSAVTANSELHFNGHYSRWTWVSQYRMSPF